MVNLFHFLPLVISHSVFILSPSSSSFIFPAFPSCFILLIIWPQTDLNLLLLSLPFWIPVALLLDCLCFDPELFLWTSLCQLIIRAAASDPPSSLRFADYYKPVVALCVIPAVIQMRGKGVKGIFRVIRLNRSHVRSMTT